MAQLYRTLSLGNVGVFESPTGTGCVALLAQPPFVPLFAGGPSACTSAFVPGHVTFEQQPLPVAHRGGSRARLTGWVGFPPQGFFKKEAWGLLFLWIMGLWDYYFYLCICNEEKSVTSRNAFFPQKNTYFFWFLLSKMAVGFMKKGLFEGFHFFPKWQKVTQWCA